MPTICRKVCHNNKEFLITNLEIRCKIHNNIRLPKVNSSNNKHNTRITATTTIIETRNHLNSKLIRIYRFNATRQWTKKRVIPKYVNFLFYIKAFCNYDSYLILFPFDSLFNWAKNFRTLPFCHLKSERIPNQGGER